MKQEFKLLVPYDHVDGSPLYVNNFLDSKVSLPFVSEGILVKRSEIKPDKLVIIKYGVDKKWPLEIEISDHKLKIAVEGQNSPGEVIQSLVHYFPAEPKMYNLNGLLFLSLTLLIIALGATFTLRKKIIYSLKFYRFKKTIISAILLKNDLEIYSILQRVDSEFKNDPRIKLLRESFTENSFKKDVGEDFYKHCLEAFE